MNRFKKIMIFVVIPVFVIFAGVTAWGYFVLMPKYQEVMCHNTGPEFPLKELIGFDFDNSDEVYVDSATLTAQENQLIVLSPDGRETQFRVEVADNDAKRRRGLMHRRRMDRDSGMLFLFWDVKERSFWMKNTHLPLDILFLNRDGTVAKLHENAEPRSTASIHSGSRVWAVLELNGGTAKDLGLVPGGGRVIHEAFDPPEQKTEQP